MTPPLVAASPDRPDTPLTGTVQSQLLTVLGEVMEPAGAPAWTSAILRVLAGLGVDPRTSRQAIARASDAGWLEAERRGRAVRWHLTPTARALTQDIRQRTESLSRPHSTWDGNCLILIISIPQSHKALRSRLYRALAWAGFGNPAPALWVGPHLDHADEIKNVIADLGLQGFAMGFIGTTWSVGLTDPEIVHRAWDLDDVATRYNKLLAQFGNLAPVNGDEFLLAHLALTHECNQLPLADPQLPDDLLPNWIGRRALPVLTAQRTAWSIPARQRWHELNDQAD